MSRFATTMRFSLVVFVSFLSFFAPTSGFAQAPSQHFIRGDVNTNGNINISDGYWVLLHLFGTPSLDLECMDAADSNNDGLVDLGDAIYLYCALLGLGPLPPAPFPDCGLDTADTLGCANTGCTSNTVPPCNLVYPLSFVMAPAGVVFTAQTPTVGCGPVATWQVTPLLPDGLQIDPIDGTISGTATTDGHDEVHLITASNGGGSTSFNVRIRIDPIFTYQTSPTTGSYSTSTGVGGVNLVLTLVEDSGNPTYPTDISGFNLVLSHDALALTTTVASIGPSAVLQALNAGAGPTFWFQDTQGDEVVIGSIFSFTTLAVMQFDTEKEVVLIDYETIPAVFIGQTGPVSVDFIWVEDSPLTATTNDLLVVTDGNLGFNPLTVDAEVLIHSFPIFTYQTSPTTGSYSTSTGVGSVNLALTLVEDSGNPTYPTDIAGFNLAISHDELSLTVASMGPSAVMQALNGGNGPTFWFQDTQGDEVVIGSIFSFTTLAVMQFDTEKEVVLIDYETIPAVFIGQTGPVSVDFIWVEDSPLTTTTSDLHVQTDSAQGITPLTVDAEVLITASP